MNRFENRTRTAASMLLIALCTVPIWAQEHAPGTTSGPTLLPSQAAQLKNMEPAVDEVYTLGGGDELSIECAGRPELSGKHVVGPDGRITLPLSGTLQVAGLTREQASAAIAKAYSTLYSDPSITLRIDKYGSNRILMLGYVQHPGVMYFDQTPTLLEAITRAGLLPPPDKKEADTVPDRCAIYRGNQQVVWIDVRALLESGSPLADLRLRRNDIVFVPNDSDRFVSVLGDVQHPGAVSLKRSSTLPSVLADAGGLTERAGNANIQIIDPATGKTRSLRFKELMTPAGSLEVSLRPGEVIYVSRSGLQKAGYVLQQLTPLATTMTFAAVTAF